MKNKHKNKTSATKPPPPPPSALHLAQTSQPDPHRLGFSFPTQLEAMLFKHSWLAIIFAGTIHTLIWNRIDIIFITTTTVLTLSAGLFRYWLSQLPKTLEFTLHNIDSPLATTLEHIKTSLAKSTDLRRFIIPTISVAFSCSFLAFFIRPIEQSVELKASWYITLLLWSWIIGTAGHITFAIARLFRTLGSLGTIQYLPEHPDKCGGLQPLGSFFTLLASPLVLVTTYLALAAFAHAPTIQLLSSISEFTRTIQPRELLTNPVTHLSMQPSTHPQSNTAKELRIEVLRKQLENIKTDCSKIDIHTDRKGYVGCIQLANSTANQISILTYKPGFARTVVHYSRVGLAILVASTILCLMWPLQSFHNAMLKRRNEIGQELAIRLNAISNEISTALSKSNTSEASALSKDSEEIIKHAHRVQGYPTWPFRPSLLTKVIIPQALALMGASWKFIEDLLSVLW